MNFQEFGKSLRSINFNDLDVNNLGVWPLPVKVIACSLVFAVVLGLGYQFYLSDIESGVEREAAQELQLREEFKNKMYQVANLNAFRAQLKSMEDKFGEMLRRLPTDTEVPGLLEDITRTGLESGLEFSQIRLLPEKTEQFYIELPIQIEAKGGYHDLATFISGVANSKRIVTLHDFDVKPADAKTGGKTGQLMLSVLAKTYRYNENGLKK